MRLNLSFVALALAAAALTTAAPLPMPGGGSVLSRVGEELAETSRAGEVAGGEAYRFSTVPPPTRPAPGIPGPHPHTAPAPRHYAPVPHSYGRFSAPVASQDLHSGGFAPADPNGILYNGPPPQPVPHVSYPTEVYQGPLAVHRYSHRFRNGGPPGDIIEKGHPNPEYAREENTRSRSQLSDTTGSWMGSGFF